ncbi:MAG: RagB/SusD family nutrient uptake outer membrane protein [Bacteroidales bacterium]|nr:RagB/SusD family nutrient uptake outer membrane protein [Bacteroidales bacterium]MBR1960020.1 RagB/SusD family nutrient uptake outer membrane protein [Bacteroidales bacterium]
MKKILSILAFAAIMVSCADDFLDKVPLDKLSEDAVFNSPQLAESYVNALYPVLPDPFQEGNISNITDESFFRYGGSSTRYMYDGRLSPSTIIYISEGGSAHDSRTTVLNIWNRAYEFIYKMNYFLRAAESEDSRLEKETADRLKGEVYFLRAWAYYNLIQRYAGVPIIKVPHSIGGEEDFSVERSNFDDCVDFILEDLDKADALLPSKDATPRGRVNRDVALALRARVTLLAASKLFNDPDSPQSSIFKGAYDYQGKWQRAYDACKAMVDRADVDGAYALDDKYSDYWKDLDSPELIWAKYFVVTEDIDKAQLYYSIEYYNGWTSMQPTQAMMIDYEMNNGKKFFEEGSGFDPKKPFANRDPRFYYSIATPFSKYGVIEDGSYNEYDLQMYLLFKDKTREDFTADKTMPDYTDKAKDLAHAVTHTGLELRKWYDPQKPITDKQTITPFYPWFRLAEFYLNFAECAYMLGKEDECRTYINKVRGRADVNMPPVTEGGTSLWDRLVNERRIEMAFEFTRYFDVRRWMIADKYENVPIAGMKTMILENGTKRDTVYRMARLASDVDKNTCYYWENSSERDTYIAGNNGRDIITKWTYTWLGQDYEIDYGECPLTFSPTQKYFVPANYLMPIPETEIKKSQNTIEQNPGY